MGWWKMKTTSVAAPRWGSGRFVLSLLLFAVLALTVIVGPVAAQQDGETTPDGAEQSADKTPITMDILADDAVLVISKSDGRDIVRVIGRTRIDHKSRSVWTDELEYDEDAGYAVMNGDVELVDTGDDALNLNAAYLELDLNTEAAYARDDVRFQRDDAAGTSDVLHYGEYAELAAIIDAELSRRTPAAANAVRSVLSTFLADDKVLILQGTVDMIEGEREFRSEFVVINTRDDAMVSLGRSAATLPAPGDD